ncbi:MAG: cation:proton antiporter [Elusimicrobiota bacterium]|jgi:CPA2 family monovalent cation:H+ antiporter-2
MQEGLLQDLAVVIAAAAAAALLCRRLRQPAVIGYLLAGVLVGPHMPHLALVRDMTSIRTMAELGIAFLMFALGLEFNLPRLRRVGPAAVVAAAIEVSFMLWLGYRLGRVLGWAPIESVFLGGIVAISSTTLIVKTLSELGLAHNESSQLVFGILIIEDVAAVTLLSIVSGLGSSTGADALGIARALAHTTLFVILYVVLGLSALPRLLRWAGEMKTHEVLGILSLGLCLLGALLGSRVVGSAALGAFLTGAIVAASEELPSIEAWIHPVRDMFSALFFVSAGMLIEPHLLWTHRWVILAFTAAVLAGKTFSGAAGALAVGRGIKASFCVGASLAQIGEFSFVIAGVGAASRLAGDSLYAVATSVSLLSALCAPRMIAGVSPFVDKALNLLPPAPRALLKRHEDWAERPRGRRGLPPETAILSRYLVRLVVYCVLSFGVVLCVQSFSGLLTLLNPSAQAWSLWSLWTIAALGSLPFWTSVSKYGSHLMLLIVTSGLAAKESSRMLRILDVHRFYNALHVLFILAMALAFLVFEASSVAAAGPVWATAGLVLLMEVIERHRVATLQERAERLLDEVIGLATSEPTRQALRESQEESSFLFGMTEPVMVPESVSAVHKPIADLDIRKRTGASIIAIYRQGRHIANPAPSTELLPDDVVILFGEPEERQKALSLLLSI